MKKKEFIERYGEAAWKKRLERNRQWNETNPERVKAHSQAQCRKGGSRYETQRNYNRMGLQGERRKIRSKHARKWRPYKKIIAPGAQIHHQWIPKTLKYKGLALVEKYQHQHGIIDIIKILEGEITLLTEREIKEQEITLGAF